MKRRRGGGFVMFGGVSPTYYLTYPGQVARWDASIGGLTIVDAGVSAWSAVTAGDSAGTGVADPDGGTGAISLIEGSTTGAHYLDGTETTLGNTPANPRDLFLRAGSRSNIVIYHSSTCAFALNLASGVGSQITGSGGSITCTDVGGGWKRVVNVVPNTSAGSVACRVYASTTNPATANSYAGGSGVAFELFQRGTSSWQRFVSAWADQIGGHHITQAVATRYMSAIGPDGLSPASVGGYASPYLQGALATGKALENSVAGSRAALRILHSGEGVTLILAGIAGIQHNAVNRTLFGTSNIVSTAKQLGANIYAPNVNDGSLVLRVGNSVADVIPATAIGSLTAGQGFVIGYRMSTAYGWSVRNGANTYSGALSAAPAAGSGSYAFRFGTSGLTGVDHRPALGMVINSVVSDSDLVALMRSVDARFSLRVTV